MQIHPSAIVDSKAELASDVEVQAFSIIHAGAVIGPGCVIGPHCVIGSGTVMGAGNQFFSGAQVGIPPQDLKHLTDRYGNTIIGDNNIFREFVTISSSTVYENDDHEKATRIGSNCLFMACTHVAHDCEVGNGVIMANNSALAGHVTVRDRVSIGGLSGIHQFCVLGQMAFIGGMTRVTKDVLPYMLVEGSPAKCHGPNTVGLERSGMRKEAIARIRSMYRLLYRSDLNTSQAIEEIEENIEESPERSVILDFIRESKRGISK